MNRYDMDREDNNRRRDRSRGYPTYTSRNNPDWERSVWDWEGPGGQQYHQGAIDNEDTDSASNRRNRFRDEDDQSRYLRNQPYRRPFREDESSDNDYRQRDASGQYANEYRNSASRGNNFQRGGMYSEAGNRYNASSTGQIGSGRENPYSSGSSSGYTGAGYENDSSSKECAYSQGSFYSSGFEPFGRTGQYASQGDQQGSMGSSYSGKGPKGYTRSRERIEEEINEVLTRHPSIDASEIEIEVGENGEISLKGSVTSRNAKRLAEDIVENCYGVTNVQNQLRVQQSDRSSDTSDSKRSASDQSGKTSGGAKGVPSGKNSLVANH